MNRLSTLLVFLSTALLTLLNGAKGEKTLTFQSSEDQVQLLELFTSQGCSSCPPAERWIHQFAEHPGLWDEIVPVVYHVDYWDQLGWKDPFATRQFTERQYAYARDGSIRQVYTPCFVSNGNEWRGYFQQESLPKANGSSGVLKAQIKGNRLTANYSEKKPLTLNIAILGFDLTTDVKRGENRGRKLDQQFVVLDHQTVASSNGNWATKMPKIDLTSAEQYAIALWVTQKGKFKPLQATGSWIDSPHLN